MRHHAVRFLVRAYDLSFDVDSLRKRLVSTRKVEGRKGPVAKHKPSNAVVDSILAGHDSIVVDPAHVCRICFRIVDCLEFPGGQQEPVFAEIGVEIVADNPIVILDTLKQLALTADQRTELASAMKAEKGQRADLDRALQDARRALANALANGQTFLDPEIESLTSANAKVQESNLKLWAKLYALFSPDQQRRLLTMSTPLSLASASHELARNQ